MPFLAVVVLNLVAGFQALGTLLSVGLMLLPAVAARQPGAVYVASSTALSTGIAVQANWIGVGANGTSPLAGSAGIVLNGNASVTIGLKAVENPLEFGIVVTDEDGRVERFLEKPSWGQVFSDTINTGIYVIEPEVP